MLDLNSFCILLAEEGAGRTPAILTFLPWILIGVLFYLMIIRPQNRKQAELKTMLGSLKKNDRVVTVGGIFGTIVNAPKDSEEITIKVDENNNTRLRVQRSSISRVITAESSAEGKDS
jgi:preprotein translocase subunit YajC